MFFRKYFWIISFCVYFIVTFFSYSFIKDLYFYKEDFADIYHLFFGGNQFFPYHGIKYIILPLYLLFGDQPSGYFWSAVFLYWFLCLVLAFFMWRLTKSYLIAFFSGLILASGYIGSESMFMVELAIPQIMYLLLMLGAVLFYREYLLRKRSIFRIISLSIYLLTTIAISQRAHSLFLIIFLTDLYFFKAIKKYSLIENIFRRVNRLFPFILVSLGFYAGIPFLLGNEATESLKVFQKGSDIINPLFYLALLSDLGNYLVPSVFQEKLIEILEEVKVNYFVVAAIFIGLAFGLLVSTFIILKPFIFVKNKKFYVFYFASFLIITVLAIMLSYGQLALLINSVIGIFLLYVLLGIISSVHLKKDDETLLVFLVLSWLLSYVVYLFREPTWIHPSWSRYLASGFPFFASIIAIIVVRIFLSSRYPKLKIIGWGFLLVVVFSNLTAGYISPFKNRYLERSFYLKKFISSLRQAVPKLGEGRSLFYFDIVSHGPTEGLFNSFLATGSYTEEIALATFYKEEENHLKIVKDYNQFRKDYKKGHYDKIFVFFYDYNKNLHDISDYFLQDNDNLSLKITNLSKIKFSPYYKIAKSNRIELKDNKILYESTINSDNEKSYSINNILKLELNKYQFPSYKPLHLGITLRATTTIKNITIYPYKDTFPVDLPIGYSSLSLQDDKTLNTFLKYIAERENFRKIATIRSHESAYSYNPENLIDGYLETGWFANKKVDAKNKENNGLEIILPKEQIISEVRWISLYKANIPTDYEYQIFDENDNLWKTVFSVNNRGAKQGEYSIDKI